MMNLVDTCGWIEWLSDGKLQSSFAKYLKDTPKLIIPTIVQYELFEWVCREKDEACALDIIGVTEASTVIPLDTSIAILAAKLSRQHKLAMADSLILASAQKSRFQIPLLAAGALRRFCTGRRRPDGTGGGGRGGGASGRPVRRAF